MLIRLELALLVIEAIAFVALYAWRSRWTSTPVGRLVMLWVLFGALDFAALLAIGTPAQPPLWLYAVSFGAQVVLGAWRLLLLVRTQQESEKR